MQELEKIETKKYDIVVLLQPTVPFRRADHIDNAVNSFKSSNFDSLITVQKQDYPPWWMFQLKNKKLIQSFKYKNNINVFNLERQQFSRFINLMDRFMLLGLIYSKKIINLLIQIIVVIS